MRQVLVRAGPGTGKTWMAKQAVFTLADRLLLGQGGASNDGIRLVPIVVFVQRIIYLLREGNDSKSNPSQAHSPTTAARRCACRAPASHCRLTAPCTRTRAHACACCDA